MPAIILMHYAVGSSAGGRCQTRENRCCHAAPRLHGDLRERGWEAVKVTGYSGSSLASLLSCVSSASCVSFVPASPAHAKLLTILQNNQGSLEQGWQHRADGPSPGARGLLPPRSPDREVSAAGPTETVRGLAPAPRLLWGASCSPELGRRVHRTESPLPRQLCSLCLAGLPAFFSLKLPRFSDARPSQL